MLTFAIAVFVLAATPGPALLSILGTGAAFGFRVGLKYVMGALVGANVVILLVISGLANFLESLPQIRVILIFISLCYLSYIAFQIASYKSNSGLERTTNLVGFKDGLIIQLINPKAYAVALALFSGFPFSKQTLFVEIYLKLLITNVIFVPAYLAWLLTGVKLNSLNLSHEKARKIKITLAFLMLVAAFVSVLPSV